MTFVVVELDGVDDDGQPRALRVHLDRAAAAELYERLAEMFLDELEGST